MLVSSDSWSLQLKTCKIEDLLTGAETVDMINTTVKPHLTLTAIEFQLNSEVVVWDRY